MPSPDLRECAGDLQKLHDIKLKLERIDKLRDEFICEMKKCYDEDSNLRNYKSLLDELSTEKLALVDELRHINTDINTLETTIKQAENERQKSIDTARRIFTNELMLLKDEINELRDSMNQERLPANLVEAQDIERLYMDANPSQTNVCSDIPNSIWPTNQFLPYPMGSANPQAPFLNAAMMAAVANIQQNASANRANANSRNIDACSMVNSLADSGASSGVHTPATAEPQSGPVALPKQQPPPMKTCSSCQQQIHRNAPICPLCKSKSRSRHPKKQKQRSSATKATDQQNRNMGI